MQRRSKISSTVILRYINVADNCDIYQFCFKKKHSIGLCKPTGVVKRTTDIVSETRCVFACFVDCQKAVEWVNYWKLFSQVLEDCSDACLVRLLEFWHSRQTLSVHWQGLLIFVLKKI